jgi:hypothetical protein
MEKTVLGPGIVAYKNAIKKEWNMIERLEKSLGNETKQFKWRGSRVGYFQTDNESRNCQDFIYTKEILGERNDDNSDLMDMHDLVHSSIRECLDDYQTMFAVNVKFIGAFNMVKYGPGEKFTVHTDDGEPYRCTVSTVGYINDDYQGGELYFDKFDLNIKPDAGDLILFPSSYIYSHASVPVESGIKYAIVCMTDWSDYAHRNDSPIYKTVDSRSE